MALVVLLQACGGEGGIPDAGTPIPVQTVVSPPATQADAGNSPVTPPRANACVFIEDWPGTEAVAGYIDDVPYPFTTGFTFVEGTSSYEYLELDDFHLAGTYPKTVAFQSSDTITNCDVCLTLARGCVDGQSGTTCSTYYFQQDGNAVIQQADQDAGTGSFIATVSNATLVEWTPPQQDGTGDVAVPDGGCYTLGNASWNVGW